MNNYLSFKEYTLKDLIDKVFSTNVKIGVDLNLESVNILFPQIYATLLETPEKRVVVNNLLKNYVFMHILDSTVLKVNSTDNEESLIDTFIRKALLKVNEGFDKYFNLINQYEAIKNDLTSNNDFIESTTKTRFNDTPQQEGDYSAEEYTTTISQIEGKTSNPNRILNIEKLGRINNLLDNYYNNWSLDIIYFILK